MVKPPARLGAYSERGPAGCPLRSQAGRTRPARALLCRRQWAKFRRSGADRRGGRAAVVARASSQSPSRSVNVSSRRTRQSCSRRSLSRHVRRARTRACAIRDRCVGNMQFRLLRRGNDARDHYRESPGSTIHGQPRAVRPALSLVLIVVVAVRSTLSHNREMARARTHDPGLTPLLTSASVPSRDPSSGLPFPGSD